MTIEQQAEAIELQRQMHAYFNTLVASGMSEAIVVTAAMTAAAERVLMVSTPTQAAAFLHGQAHIMEKHGAALKAACLNG